MKIEFYCVEFKGNGSKSVNAKLWYWRLNAKNGKTVADGSESYSNRGNVQRACRKVAALFKPGSVEIVEAKS